MSTKTSTTSTKTVTSEKAAPKVARKGRAKAERQPYVTVSSAVPTIPPVTPYQVARDRIDHAAWLRQQHWWTPSHGARQLDRIREAMTAIPTSVGTN